MLSALARDLPGFVGSHTEANRSRSSIAWHRSKVDIMLLQKSGESKIMDFKVGNLQKHVTQLHKSLERLPKRPPPEDVHQLRRQIRILEAIMNALTAGRVRHLLKALILVRKAAGKVRDMDVLVELACSLSTARNAECLVQLLEYLGGRRVKAAAKLQAIISAQRKEALRSLKRCSRLIEKGRTSSKKTTSTNQKLPLNTVALVRSLSAELSNCPRINKENLHSYRLKIKELHYILQLVTDGDRKVIAALGEAKDAIGGWHDWTELATITKRVLGHGPTCGVLKQVQLISREKLKRAISVANEMRKKSFRENTFAENGRK
jgi:CHAD domain-containing protein